MRCANIFDERLMVLSSMMGASANEGGSDTEFASLYVVFGDRIAFRRQAITLKAITHSRQLDACQLTLRR
ncbi:MAG: hypothetical protein ACR2PG_19920 [Hyphomicrobiaceae bacterium]